MELINKPEKRIDTMKKRYIKTPFNFYSRFSREIKKKRSTIGFKFYSE